MGVKFFYYHCSRGCKERQRANDMNAAMLKRLAGLKANYANILLMGEILKQRLKDQNTNGKSELEKLQKEIAKQKQRLKNGKDLMLDGEISASEYKEMKYEIEEQIEKLNAEETKLREGIENFTGLVDDSLDIIQNADKYYVDKGTTSKQRIVSSIFPEKLVFENNDYRTPKLNEAVELLCRNDKGFGGNKKGKNLHFTNSSLGVVT